MRLLPFTAADKDKDEDEKDGTEEEGKKVFQRIVTEHAMVFFLKGRFGGRGDSCAEGDGLGGWTE